MMRASRRAWTMRWRTWALGLLPPELIRAHELLTRYLVVSRLAAPGAQEPAEATRPLVARACGCQSWDDLLASYEEARQSVDQRWRAIVEQYGRSEEHTSELQSLLRISYAVFCLQKKTI